MGPAVPEPRPLQPRHRARQASGRRGEGGRVGMVNRETFPARLRLQRTWWGGLRVAEATEPDAVEYIRRHSVLFELVAKEDAPHECLEMSQGHPIYICRRPAGHAGHHGADIPGGRVTWDRTDDDLEK